VTAQSQYWTPTKTLDLKPGQLWKWNWRVGDGSWIFEIVTAARRLSPTIIASATMKMNDTFMLVSTDDEGPWGFNPHHDWVVALHRDVLIWMRRPDLLCALLIEDT
jgi:hypothetical protein